jgi:RNA polymerase sigma factor (sigma-70 family)
MKQNARLSEAEMAEGLKTHDQQVFVKIYEAFSPALYGSIINFVKDKELAENLLQDVFVKAWNCSAQFDASKGGLFIWMYKISRNICIDYSRSKRHRINKLSLLCGDTMDWVKNRGEIAISPDQIGLRKIVQRLKKDEREMIELLYFRGFTQAEVASITAMPIGTVKTRSSRAIKSLRRFFAMDEACAQYQLAIS